METQPLLLAWQQQIILASLLRSTDSGVEGFVNCNTSGHWPDRVFKDQTLVREDIYRISNVYIMTQRVNKRTPIEVLCIVESIAHMKPSNECHVSWYYLCQPLFEFPFTSKYHGNVAIIHCHGIHQNIWYDMILSWYGHSTFWIGFGMKFETIAVENIWKEGRRQGKEKRIGKKRETTL